MPKRGRKKRITNDNIEVSQDKANDGHEGVQMKKIKKPRVKKINAPKAENFPATEQPPAIVENKIEPVDEGEEKKKKLIMWVGISCIMAVFFIAWIFTLKYEFKSSANKNSGNLFNWSQAKSELDKAMTQVKQGVEQIKQIQKNASSALPKESELTAEQINLLKGKLLNEVASSTTASSTVEN